MFDVLAAIPETDLAYGWVRFILADDDSAYASAIATFTSTMAFLGSLVLAWYVTAGVVSSAYSGKVLGDRYHQIYAPLRVALGFGLLVPISDGLSAVHILLRDIVGPAAINLANAPIKYYVGQIATGKQSAVIRGHQGEFVVRQLIQMEGCMMVVNEMNKNRHFGSGLISKSGPRVETNTQSSWGLFGDSTASTETAVWDYGDCGSIQFTLKSPDETEAINAFYTERLLATTNAQNAVSNIITSAGIGEYLGKYGGNGFTNQEILDELQRRNIIPANLLSAFQSEVKTWNSAVGTAATKVFHRDNEKRAEEISDFINTYGFMAAGATERTLAQIGAQASRLASETPVTIGPRLEGKYLDAYGQILHVFSGVSQQNRATQVATGEATVAEDDAIADGTGVMARLLSKVSPFLARPPVGSADHDKLLADPVGGMIAFGHTLLNAFQVLFVATTALSATIDAGVGATDNPVGWFGLKAAAKGIAGAFDFMSGWIVFLMGLLLVIGVLHAFILPMIPFIMVIIMGVGWIVMFLEAIIAAPLWAFAMVRTDGQDFFDRGQTPGLTLLFNLFLRPAVGMLAFIGGSLLISKVMWVVLTLWDQAAGFQMTKDFLGIFYWAASNILLVFIMWHLYLRIFGLIPTIADHITHWLGLGTSPTTNDGQETMAAVGAAVGVGMATRQAPITPKPRQPKQSSGGTKITTPSPTGPSGARGES